MMNWINWFKDVEDFVYVGLDVNPLCKGLDVKTDDSIHIEIGSQLDISFLDQLCTKYGPFDIIVDDGGHTAEMMATSLRALFPCLAENGYYFIEDTMSIATKDESFTHFKNQTISDYLSGLFVTMHNFWSTEEVFYNPVFSGKLKSIQMIDSLVVLEKAPVKCLTTIVGGTERIPSQTTAGMKYYLGDNQVLNVNIEVSEHSNSIPHQRIKEECLAICTAYPALIKPGSSVEECAKFMKQNVILEIFHSKDASLYGDEPITVV